MEKELLKLNLGCGKRHFPRFVNVDKYGEPELRHDLEVTPWPWEDNSVSKILMLHVLEHIGAETGLFFSIIKEMYRVCVNGATIDVAVPHPRHDHFINDPSHVRIITPGVFGLFSKKNNREWIDGNYANTPLGVYLNVDFETVKTDFILDPVWMKKLKDKEIEEKELNHAMRTYNNVVSEIRMSLKVIKD